MKVWASPPRESVESERTAVLVGDVGWVLPEREQVQEGSFRAEVTFPSASNRS